MQCLHPLLFSPPLLTRTVGSVVSSPTASFLPDWAGIHQGNWEVWSPLVKGGRLSWVLRDENGWVGLTGCVVVEGGNNAGPFGMGGQGDSFEPQPLQVTVP